MRTLKKAIKNLKTQEQIEDFIKSLFTLNEIEELEKRLSIIQMLLQGISQREISRRLKVGIATVSRGATELKKDNFKFLKSQNDKK